MGYWSKQRIREQVTQRGIEYLAHFTQVRNLTGILERGLLSRTDLEKDGLDYRASDRRRFDRQPRAISMSVSAYYIEMLRSKQRDYPDVEWVILFFDASILWTHECLFCRRNASSSEVIKHWGDLSGHKAFEEMFSPQGTPQARYSGKAYREDTGIPECLPTHPDAEVQVFEPIAPELLRGAWLEREGWAEELRVELKRRWPKEEHSVHAGPFKARFHNGYEYWG